MTDIKPNKAGITPPVVWQNAKSHDDKEQSQKADFGGEGDGDLRFGF